MISVFEMIAELTALTQAAAVGPPAISAGPLDGATLVLFINNPPVFGSNPVPGDLTQPAFTGYPGGPTPAVWTAPYINPLGQGEVRGGDVTFSCTASGIAYVITGAALLNGAGTHVLQIDVFAPANYITIQNHYDGFTYTIRRLFNPNG